MFVNTRFIVFHMKRQYTIRLEESTVERLDKIGEPYGMTAQSYGTTIMSRLADLKPEFALHALTAIPKEYFRAGPGRPSTSTSRTNADSPQLTA